MLWFGPEQETTHFRVTGDSSCPLDPFKDFFPTVTLQDRMGSGCVILHDGKRRLDVPERKLGSMVSNWLTTYLRMRYIWYIVVVTHFS